MASNKVPEFLQPIPKTTRKIKLPSNGVPYKRGPAKEGYLTLSPMTLVEENILSGNTSLPDPTMDRTSAVLEKCISESLDIDHLLAADKLFLFYMLRAITYGSDYKFSWECESPVQNSRGNLVPCGAKNSTVVNIPDDFQIKYLDETDTEPFIITLPECGIPIGFRLTRSKDAKALDRYLEEIERARKQKIYKNTSEKLFRLTNLLVEIDSNNVEAYDFDTKLNWISSLSAKDGSYYQQMIDYYTPGIEANVTLTCEECGNTQEIPLPITVEFFRPEFPIDRGPVGAEVRPDVLHGDESSGDIPDVSGGASVVPREIDRSEERRVESPGGPSESSSLSDHGKTPKKDGLPRL